MMTDSSQNIDQEQFSSNNQNTQPVNEGAENKVSDADEISLESASDSSLTGDTSTDLQENIESDNQEVQPAPDAITHDEREESISQEIRINPEAQQEQDKLFVMLANEYEQIHGLTAESEEDFKTIRKNLVDLKEKAEALFLVAKEEKEKFIDSIQDYFKSINERMDEKRKIRNEEREKTYLSIEPEIDKSIEEASTGENFTNSRKILIDLQAKLKTIDLPKNRRSTISSRIQEVFESINKKQDAYREKYEMESIENYLKIKPEIIKKKEEALSSKDFANSRKALIAAQNQIKDMKLTRQQRDELFGEIRVAFTHVNEQQDAEREEFHKESNLNYQKLKTIVQEAIDHAVNPDNYASARQRLISAQNEIKKYRLRLSHKNDLFGAIRTVFTKLNESADFNSDVMDQESLDNYQKLKTKVNEAAMNVRYSNNLNEMRNGLIAVRDEVKLLKLAGKHRKELSTSIRKAFSEYDKKKEDYFKGRKKKDQRESVNRIQKLDSDIMQLEKELHSIGSEIELEKSKIEHLAGEEEKEVINKTILDHQQSINELSQKIASLKADKDKLNG